MKLCHVIRVAVASIILFLIQYSLLSSSVTQQRRGFQYYVLAEVRALRYSTVAVSQHPEIGDAIRALITCSVLLWGHH